MDGSKRNTRLSQPNSAQFRNLSTLAHTFLETKFILAHVASLRDSRILRAGSSSLFLDLLIFWPVKSPFASYFQNEIKIMIQALWHMLVMTPNRLISKWSAPSMHNRHTVPVNNYNQHQDNEEISASYQCPDPGEFPLTSCSLFFFYMWRHWSIWATRPNTFVHSVSLTKAWINRQMLASSKIYFD